MTKLLSRSCRPLTYVLTFLLLPIVLVVASSNSASAAVVAVGPTVTGYINQDQSGTTFPGGDIDCTITGYTRLHDGGLYSIRAVVNCNWGFAYYANFQPERFDLTAHDGNDTDSNPCRFRAMAVTIQENTDTEATLTAVLQAQGPPPADCVLTSGTLSLDPGTNGGSIDPIPFPWALGALPEGTVEAGPGECATYAFRAPEYGEPFVSQSANPTVPIDPNANVGQKAWYMPVTFRAMTKPETAPADMLKLSPYVVFSGVPGTDSRTRTPAVERDTYNVFTNSTLLRVGSSSGAFLTNEAGGFIGGAQGWVTPSKWGDSTTTTPNTPLNLAQGSFVSDVLYVRLSPLTGAASTAPPIWPGYRVEGGGYHALGMGSQHMGYTDPSKVCRVYFGTQIRNDTTFGTGVPVGPVVGTQPDPVDEPPTLENPAPEPVDGGCDGFSFTDPSSWAGAGICVLVKAVRALFRVMSDVLGVLTGMAASIVNGILNGLAALFVPSDESLESMRDALDFTDHQNLTGWSDQLTTGGLLGQGGAQPAMRETGEMNTATATPSIVPGVVLSGSCQGPGIAADKLAVLGYEGTLYPFAACDGTMATVAEWTRLLLMMFVGLSAALKVFQMIAVGVGAARSASILGNFDWSEAVRR